MPALNFQERFAEAVESGEKRQTIRRVWKRPIKPGDRLYFYAGMRTKHCRRLQPSVYRECVYTRPINIDKYGITMSAFGFVHGPYEAGLGDEVAQADGFRDWAEMREWFKKIHGLPFEGVVIQW